ncbi:MAG TPA: DUF362 domain-containing protein [Bacteroidales bacterium]|nr:DUF362 domain-containing protein [Bacteroidales bacterium]
MKTPENRFTAKRRDMLKYVGLGSVSMLMGNIGYIPSVEKLDIPEIAPKKQTVTSTGRSSVAFTTGTDRRAMMFEVMKPFEEYIKKGIKGKQIVIKPNMVSTNVPLCATHVDAIRSVMDFLKPYYSGQFIIAEASAGTGESEVGFQNYGYLDLQKDYNVKFVNLNKYTGSPVFILDNNLYPDKIQIAEMLVDPKYFIISLSRLKTHNSVVLTAGVKNMMMAAPMIVPGVNGEKPTSYKRRMHAAGSRWLHYNIYQVAKHVAANFTIIDGLEGMEGNGPSNGTPVNHKIAMAGTDAFAIDSMCAKLMGIPLENVGYLGFGAADNLGIIDYEKIDIIGNKDPNDYIIKYKSNDNIATQLQWKEPLKTM